MILRYLEQSEWDDALSGKLPHFDGFHWQPGYRARADADRLIAGGKIGWRYLNVLQTPCPEWIGGDPILDRMNAILPVLASHFPWFPCAGGLKRNLYDWRSPSQTTLHELVSLMRRDEMPFWLDQFWPHPRPWMFAEGDYEAYPAASWVHWTRKIMRFRQLVGLGPHGSLTIVNGDFSVPGSISLEHPEWWGRWKEAEQLWHKSFLNLLAPDASVPWVMERLLDLHVMYPEKWVALKGPAAAVVEGYERLARSR